MNHERTKLILDLTSEGFWDWDIKNDRTYLSQNYRKLLGDLPEDTDFDKKFFENTIHPDDREQVLKIMEEHFHGQRDASVIEYRMVSKDGTFRWVEGKGKIVERDKEGNPSRMVGIITDITEHKQMEIALRESQEELRLAQRVARIGSWYWDAKTGIATGSDEFLRIHGFDQSAPQLPDFLKKRLWGYHAEEWDRLKAAIQMALQTGVGYELDLRIIRNGTDGWISIRSEVVFDGNGQIIGIRGTTQDITDRKLAEEEREELHAELSQAQKMESVGRLAGGVAHDFNNMLSVILGHSELAIGGLSPEHPVFTNLQEILMAAERSANLTRQLLAFARKQTVEPKVLDLNVTVEGMLQMLHRLIGEDIDLVWMPGSVLWPVKIDPSQIDQLLANLCVNARDAIDGVGKLTIETRNASLTPEFCAEKGVCCSTGDYVQLDVGDNGCGMEKETISRIFEPFYTTKELGKGTGLGLATVYGIVKQNKGFIFVDSQLGQATTFSIYLPRHNGVSGGLLMGTKVEAACRGNETILLVEDQPEILNICKMMLENLGYKVFTASTIEDAFECADKFASGINLLITDVIMPKMNGRDLANQLLSQNPRLKLLYMSGYTSDILSPHGVLEEGMHFIQKPFCLKDLSDKVRETLDGS